jgi:hypothetical protein
MSAPKQRSSAIPSSVPAVLRDRLARENVRTVGQWQALGPRRLKIFGLTKAHVREIDAAVRAALKALR